MGQIENIVLDGLGMNDMNEKMIDIIIKKAEALCPDSLALIGVYGSVITGDEYEEGSPFCRKTNIKVYFTRMFSGKITIKYILTGVICMAAGIFASYCYSFIVKTDVFKNTYSTVISLLTSFIYLLITAFAEEIAWRGFLLERLPFKNIKSVLFVGAVWAVWHMPMWIIRNSLGMEQIVYLCIWTLLVSIVLGITYDQCRNILLIAIMHAIFNICYLAPIQYNIVVLATIIFVGTLLYKKSGKKLFTW